jgi:hypothetical protein
LVAVFIAIAWARGAPSVSVVVSSVLTCKTPC